MRPAVLGIDIGGTKIAAGVLAPDGRVVGFRIVPSGAADGPEAMLTRIAAVGRQVLELTAGDVPDVPLVGVGCGGPLDPATGIVNTPPNLPGWIDVPVVARVEAALGRPATLENDATAAILGEHWHGAGRGIRQLAYLTISTGIGGGLILDGELRRGATGNAAEFGHVSVAWDGWPCPCGSRGCPEAFASGTNIARRAREAAAARPGRARALVALAGTVDAITAAHVVAATRDGDPLAREVWCATTDVLGALVVNLLNAFEPERVVIGGGVTRAGNLLLDPIRIAAHRALGSAARAEVVLAELGERVGVVGAACAALHREGFGAPSVTPVTAATRSPNA